MFLRHFSATTCDTGGYTQSVGFLTRKPATDTPTTRTDTSEAKTLLVLSQRLVFRLTFH